MATNETNQMLAAAAAACEDKKAEDIRILALDPAESGLTDYFLLCNGTNERQNVAIADEIELRMKRDFNTYANSVEGRRQADWILLDYVDFIVHIFSPGEARLLRPRTSAQICNHAQHRRPELRDQAAHRRRPPEEISPRKEGRSKEGRRKEGAKEGSRKEDPTSKEDHFNQSTRKESRHKEGHKENRIQTDAVNPLPSFVHQYLRLALGSIRGRPLALALLVVIPEGDLRLLLPLLFWPSSRLTDPLQPLPLLLLLVIPEGNLPTLAFVFALFTIHYSLFTTYSLLTASRPSPDPPSPAPSPKARASAHPDQAVAVHTLSSRPPRHPPAQRAASSSKTPARCPPALRE